MFTLSTRCTFQIWKEVWSRCGSAGSFCAHMTLWSSSSSGYLPVSSPPDSQLSKSKRMLRFTRNGPHSFALVAIALVTGMLGGYILTNPAHKTELCAFPFDTPNTPVDHVYSETTSSPNTTHSHRPTDGSLLVSDDLDLEALHSMVIGTRGFYARDYSMSLGWNNVGPSEVVHTFRRLPTSRCAISSRPLYIMVHYSIALS